VTKDSFIRRTPGGQFHQHFTSVTYGPCKISCTGSLSLNAWYPLLNGDLAGNTKGGSITVPLTSCLTGLDEYVLQIKTKIVSCHTADSKPVKQEVDGTVILLPLVFPGFGFIFDICFQRTFSTLKALVLPSILIKPLGLFTQANQLGILKTFVYTFHFNYLCNVAVFYFCSFSKKT
jgi:hypothetical protein